MKDEWNVCGNCLRLYAPTWRAPDEIWMGSSNGSHSSLCIDCFTEMAEAKGVALYWECSEDDFPTVKDEIKQPDWYCCLADYPNHTDSCPNNPKNMKGVPQ